MKNNCQKSDCSSRQLTGSKYCPFDTMVNHNDVCSVLHCYSLSYTHSYMGFCPKHSLLLERFPDFRYGKGKIVFLELYHVTIWNLTNER